MTDFSFHNPTHILFGTDKETHIGELLQQEGILHVLLVYGGGSIKHNGLFQRVTDALTRSGISWSEHGGVRSNPVLSHTRSGADLARENGCDAVLAVGGGSVIDEAKAIAASVALQCDAWDFYTGTSITAALPIYTILTLPASASEMNGNSVLTNETTRQKYSCKSIHLYPKLSIINPELMMSVPANYIAYAAVDIITHVLESYFTHINHTPLQNYFVEGIVKTVMETTPMLLSGSRDYDAWASFAWSATMGLNGVASAGMRGGLFANHMIEHSLSALHDIPHGAGLAIVLPAWMRWFLPQHTEPFRRFAMEVFGHGTTPEQGIDALESWFNGIGAPTKLQDVGIESGAIPAIADNAAQTAVAWGVSQTYTQETITHILQGAH